MQACSAEFLSQGHRSAAHSTGRGPGPGGCWSTARVAVQPPTASSRGQEPGPGCGGRAVSIARAGAFTVSGMQSPCPHVDAELCRVRIRPWTPAPTAGGHPALHGKDLEPAVATSTWRRRSPCRKA